MRTRFSGSEPVAKGALLASALGALWMTPLVTSAAAGDTTLVSITPSGKGTYDATYPSVSGDGRLVVFMADSSGEPLVPEPVAPGWQSYVRDTVALGTRRVGVGMGGVAANAAVDWPRISPDGRYAVFTSTATNLVAGVQNGRQQIFVQDLLTGVIEVVSVNSGEVLANGDSFAPATNADGRFVAFGSTASNLVPGDTNRVQDIFVRDRLLGVTERVSVGSPGVQGNAGSDFGATLNADGRYVAFVSSASNLVAVDTNGVADAFVKDRATGVVERVSVGNKGEQGTAEAFRNSTFLSATGRYVLFETGARLVEADSNSAHDVYLRDRQLGLTELISGPDGEWPGSSYAANPSISDDGRYVAFCGMEPFDPTDTFGRDVYVKDRVTGVFTPAGASSSGEMLYGDCSWGMISGDGRYVAFSDWADQLLTPEQRGDFVHNVFLHERRPVEVRFGVRPSALDFGPRGLGSTTTMSFWLRNRSTSNLPIRSIRLAGVDRGSFVVWHRCGALLAVGDGCGIHVLFKPTTVGAKNAAIQVSIANVARSRPVSGEGVR